MEDKKNLIVVKQLPIIEETLKVLSKDIDEKVTKANALVCNEDTVKEVKALRAKFNKDFGDLEEQRKAVKEQVLAPYMAFEEVYKIYISDKYKSADTTLKTKINTVENDLKAQKEDEVIKYFEEYLTSKKIDFVKYEDACIKVGLSDSLKSLRDKAKDYIDRIVTDLKLIESDENKVEILVEYKQNGFNVSNATLTVRNRLKAIEEAKARELEKQQMKVDEEKAVEKIEVLTRPKEVVKEETFNTTFKVVNATKQMLIDLKKFLKDGGYEIEE